MAKTKIERGFYPISISEINKLVRIANNWGYGNKDLCKYVAECTIERLQIVHEDLPIKDTLYQELVSLAHDINNGRLSSKVEITLKD